MGIIDDLLAHPGTYLGVDRDTRGQGASAAKIVVTALPGSAGVTLDYETFNADNAENVRGHAEHAVLGRTHGGGAIMVTGHSHADTVSVLRETGPGVFETAYEPSAFPVAITISIPEPGTLIHTWSYAAPGEELIERDRAEVTLHA